MGSYLSNNLHALQRQRRMQRPDDDEGMVDEPAEAGKFREENDRASVDDRAVDDLSGDDLEAHRASKKVKPNQ